MHAGPHCTGPQHVQVHVHLYLFHNNYGLSVELNIDQATCMYSTDKSNLTALRSVCVTYLHYVVALCACVAFLVTCLHTKCHHVVISALALRMHLWYAS